MTTSAPPRTLFAHDADPATLLADFAYVAEHVRHQVAAGRCSVADATESLAAAWELLTRLLVTDPPPIPIDTPAIPRYAPRRTSHRPPISC